MDKEERYEGIPLESYDNGNFAKGLIWGLAFSIPLWAIIIFVIKAIT